MHELARLYQRVLSETYEDLRFDIVSGWSGIYVLGFLDDDMDVELIHRHPPRWEPSVWNQACVQQGLRIEAFGLVQYGPWHEERSFGEWMIEVETRSMRDHRIVGAQATPPRNRAERAAFARTTENRPGTFFSWPPFPAAGPPPPRPFLSDLRGPSSGPVSPRKKRERSPKRAEAPSAA
jgi:hypothetical protein